MSYFQPLHIFFILSVSFTVDHILLTYVDLEGLKLKIPFERNPDDFHLCFNFVVCFFSFRATSLLSEYFNFLNFLFS